MKRIAALSLVAALTATGASADTTKPTVSTQVGLAGSALVPGAVVAGLVAVAVVVAAVNASSGT